MVQIISNVWNSIENKLINLLVNNLTIIPKTKNKINRRKNRA